MSFAMGCIVGGVVVAIIATALCKTVAYTPQDIDRDFYEKNRMVSAVWNAK